MLKHLHKIIFSCTSIVFFVSSAQINQKKFQQKPDQTKLEIEEKKLTDEACALYNNNEEVKAYHLAHKLIKKVKTARAKVNSNLLLAYYFNKKSLIDSSLYYTNEALKFNTVTNDSLKNRLYVLVYNLKAINYSNRGLIEESKKWHLKGIEASQKYNETDLYFTHVHGLALAYSKIGDFENALAMFKQCLKHTNDPEMVYGSYINMSEIYGRLKDFDKSNLYLNKAKNLCEEAKNSKCQAIISLDLGANSQEQGKIDEAMSFYNKSISISNENGYYRIALIAQRDMGKALIDLKKYNDAKIIISSGLENAIELGLLDEQTAIYKDLIEISVLQKDYKNAFKLSSDFYKIKDSISQLQKDKEINILEVKYKTEQKEKEITLLKKDQKLQASEIERQKEIKVITLISFLVILIPIIGLLVLYYQKLQTQSLLNSKQKEVSGQKIASLIKDQEIKLIKASILGQDKARKKIAQELHDSIGGNLAAIKLQFSSISNGNSKFNTIYQQLDETYNQVRSLSHNLMPKRFHQNDFILLLNEYMQNIGNASNINISISVYPKEAIDNLDEVLQNEIFTILQELITNTIKHANAQKADIQLDLIDNILNLVFEDNGKGFIPSATKTGIGLANIKNRLRDFKGTLFIDSHPKRGTIINIEIPNINAV
ncbi:ATP-binding protein [Mariniflexile sp. HMF6888]|uniref:tetratricopeptide repeat-containing sensor histidine kinase n=1 Tax=Mariniflexile sp. HMF6888 TaxID=3373086 RepID=UPI0037BD6819